MLGERTILVTGGSGSGKSMFSEKLLNSEKSILYIATAIGDDEETKRRIEHHKRRRDDRYRTYEGFKELSKIIETSNEDAVLLDCISLLITNHMFKENRDYDFLDLSEVEDMENEINKEIEELIYACKKQKKTLVMVTNEVGYSVVPEFKVNRVFRSIIGRVNQLAASLSDDVYLVACGLPIKLK